MSQTQYHLPDFLGIGAHKGGTTWLHSQLRYHPEIWIPRKKELHYFDKSLDYPSPNHLSCSRSLFRRLIGSEKQNKRFRERFIKDTILTLSDPIGPKWEGLKWIFKYYFGSHDDAWYLSLFEDAGTAVKGEITPSYSMLNDLDVQHISELMPSIKIIFLIRNPVDRAWSSIRYDDKHRGRRHRFSSLEEQLAVASEEGFESRSNYIKSLNTWRLYFPEENFFIGFYDEIKENPGGLLKRLFKFLGVSDSDDFIPTSLSKRVNKSPSMSIPLDLQYCLAEKYHDQVKELSLLFGSYACNWLAEVEDILDQRTPLTKREPLARPL